MDLNLTLMQIAALAVAGMCHALLGSVKVPLARKLDIDEARVGGLASVFGFTVIPMVIAAGFLVDYAGKEAVLAGGFAMVIASLILLTRLNEYRTALVAVLLLGTGWSALVNVLNVTSPWAFLEPDQFADHMHYAMNMGDFIFGMGAFMTPVLIGLVLRNSRFEVVFVILAVAAIIPPVIGLGVDWQRMDPPAAKTVENGLQLLLSDPIVWLCCLAFFCHVPIEAATATWATTLMTEKGVSESTSTSLLSVFWLTFMGSRLVTALTLPGDYVTHLVVAMSTLCIVCTLGIALSRRASTTCALVIAAGLVLGPIFPTLIGMLLNHVTQNIDPGLGGRAVGLFFCIGGIGWTVVPMLIGQYAKKTSVPHAFLLATASAVLLTAFSLGLMFQLSK